MARGLEPAGVEFIAENLDPFIRGLGKADKAQDDLGKSAEKLAGSYRDANGRLRDANGRFISAGDSAEGAGKKTKKTGEQVEKTGKQVKETEGAVGKFGQSFSMLGSIVTGVSTAFVTFALDAAVAASKALVGIAQDSIQVAIDFDSSMATLSIAASATGLSFDELSETALAVGGDTSLLGVSASGAAESMEGLFKAGLTTEEVFGDLQGYLAGTAELGGTLRASIDLAAATTLDMVAASDVASIALATFGSEAEEAGISTDEWINAAMNNLVQTADASVAEVDGLVEALKMVGPAASAMGVTLAETNNALALLSTRGIQGSSAGTALNRMMADLVKGTPKATEMMEDLGISVYDSEGSFLPLVEIIGQFEIALGDATDAERDAAMASIFTAQGARAMNTLLEEGVQGWVDMTDATADAATMQEQAAVKAETFAAKQEALQGVIETLQIAIGTPFLDAMGGVAGMFSEIAVKYTPLITEAFEKVGAIIGDLVNWFAVLLEEGDPLNDFLANLPSGMQEVIRTAIEIVEIFGKVRDVFKFEGLAGAMAQLNLAQALGIDPKIITTIMGIPDKIIAAFGKIQEWFVTNGPAIENALRQIGQAYMAAFGSIWEVIQDSVIPALKEVWEVFQETWEVVKEVLGELGIEFDESASGIETFANIIMIVVETSGGIVAGVLNALAGTVKFFGEHFQGVWMGIRDVVQGVKEWFEGFKQFWTALFNKDMPGALEGLEKGFKATAKFIKGMVKVIVKSISMPFKGLYKLIEGFVKGVIKFFENLKKKLVGGSIIPDMMDKIEKVIDTVLSAILKVWEAVFEKILDVTQDIFESIERTVDRVMTTVEKIIDTITTAIGGNWEDFVDLLFELWEETWEDIQDAVDTIFSAIEALIDQIAGSIESLWDSFTETLEEVWENAWNAIQSAVDSIFNAIEALMDSIMSSIESAWSTFTSTLEQVWSTAWDAIQNTVDTILNAIESLMDSISGSITSAWESFTSSIQSTWETVWSAIQSFVDATFNAIEGLMDSISGSIEAAWGTFTSAVQSTWETTWNAIETFVNTVFGNIETAIGTISGSIETTWNTWVGNLRSAFETMFNALEGIVNTAMGLVRDAVSSALSALANILAVGSNLYNGIMTIGHNIANSIRDGVVALWNAVTGAITTKLEALGAAGTFAMQVWSKVSELGKKIVSMIKSGLTTLWDAATGVVGALKEKLLGLLGSVGDATWETLKKIGVGIMNMVLQGVKSAGQFATNFWNWLWGQITDWLGGGGAGAVGESVGDKVGTGVMDSMVSSVYSQAGRFTDALNYVVGQASGDWTGTTMMQAAAGFAAPLGMVAPAMMAPAAMTAGTEITIGPNYINDGMDVAEFETRVRQAVSEAI